ncbi:hypothetical protein EDD27_8584 [Nonomuraea polychroma]|uniref:Uncharacterized protein n=1 Tax=Nonomuraea polychroma TaxID=46176 RepID=A0A438MIW5_9ACTN|nr:hypothetical protein [Nonomuraea polychroma]RVX45767.1 hypothetical protein EDD27_8584 [Nonomuraea polychroma]
MLDEREAAALAALLQELADRSGMTGCAPMRGGWPKRCTSAWPASAGAV